MVVLGSFAFSVTSYSFAAAQNVTSAAPTSNATTPGNATTGGNLTAPTSNATAPAGNVTGGNVTGGGTPTANATGEIDTFHARGRVASIVSSALAGENSTSGTNASSPADQYILGGDVRIDVMNGDAQRVQVNMSMAKPDGSDFHMHLIDNFTAGGAANETTTSNATAPAGNVTGGNVTGGGTTTANATGNATAGNATAGGNTTTMQQIITGGNASSGNATGGGNATTAGNITGGNVTAPTSNATTPAGNVTAPSNETTTANLAQATLSQDGTFKISGMANIYTNGDVKWQNVPVTIESTGRVLTINIDAEKTDNHFMGLPIYGFVTGLVGNQNGNLVSLLPPLTGAAAAPTPAAPATPPTGNATTPGNVTAPSANATAPAGNVTAPAGNQTTPAPAANSTGASGGGTKVSITQGASSKTNDAFDPNPVKAKVGDTVTWTNDDSTPHTVVSGSNAKPDGKFDSSPGLKTLITPGQTFSHKFTEAGEYPYYCQLHPTMVGTVSVS